MDVLVEEQQQESRQQDLHQATARSDWLRKCREDAIDGGIAPTSTLDSRLWKTGTAPDRRTKGTQRRLATCWFSKKSLVVSARCHNPSVRSRGWHPHSCPISMCG